MSTLDSSSTLDDVIGAIKDNGSYAEDGSLAKAKAFITAGNLWLVMAAQSSALGSSSLAFDSQAVKERIEAAERWVAVNAEVSDGGAGVVHCDLSDFRS